ncbi:hypothetical protein EPYR_00408 [Erwinia pyrifoliae DSM 12163]|nr:hypothetical protein EPYR_00408 [Erwinia pyrifoliae DSM 12163]
MLYRRGGRQCRGWCILVMQVAAGIWGSVGVFSSFSRR